jgi:hypothetical protein
MDESPGIGEATKLAKEYVDQYRADDWEEVVDASTRPKRGRTRINFQTSNGNVHKITVDADRDITKVSFDR